VELASYPGERERERQEKKEKKRKKKSILPIRLLEWEPGIVLKSWVILNSYIQIIE
jgi:hypothetical protein